MAETMIVDADDLEPEYEPEVETAATVTEDETPPEEETPEEEVSIEIEGKGQKVETEKSEVESLKAQIRELSGEILKLSAQPKQQPVAEKPKEERLTKAQLTQLLAENADKPEVLLNIIEYMTEQKTKDVKEEAFKELSKSNWYRETAGVANRVLAEDKDGYIAANPGVNARIDEVVQNLQLGDNPAGRLAAYALIRFGEGIGTPEAVKDVSKKEPPPNKGKMDKTRTTGKPNTTAKLSPEQLAMAKKMGVKPETYARFVTKGA